MKKIVLFFMIGLSLQAFAQPDYHKDNSVGSANDVDFGLFSLGVDIEIVNTGTTDGTQDVRIYLVFSEDLVYQNGEDFVFAQFVENGLCNDSWCSGEHYWNSQFNSDLEDFGISSGCYNVLCVIDPGSDLAETNENNNVFLVDEEQVCIEGSPNPVVNYVVSEIEAVPYCLNPDGQMEVSVTVKNIGNSDDNSTSSLTNTRLWLSEDSNPSLSDDLLANWLTVPTLDSGEEYTSTEIIDVPDGLTEGQTYYLCARANNNGGFNGNWSEGAHYGDNFLCQSINTWSPMVYPDEDVVANEIDCGLWEVSFYLPNCADCIYSWNIFDLETNNLIQSGDSEVATLQTSTGVYGNYSVYSLCNALTSISDALYFDAEDLCGCTNPSACNYENWAETDDGSCIFFVDECGECGGEGVSGCSDSTAYNYESLVDCDDGSCVYTGCTDPLACNFDSEAAVDNGECFFDCDDCGVSSTELFFIPDDQSQCYYQEIEVVTGIDNMTIDDVSDVEMFWVDMEHSYLGDLSITFICPEGQSLVVHSLGGGGAFLGEPMENASSLDVGECYNYSWNQNPEYGTFEEESEYETLPEGSYAVVGDWQDLVGCSVNGTWEIEICDYWAADNGFVCSWGIEFDSSVLIEDCDSSNFVFGCMDQFSCNFNSEATINDGSCIYFDCITYDQISVMDEYCDSTLLSVTFTDLAPEWAVFTLTVDGQEVEQTVENNQTYTFMIYNEGYYETYIDVFVSQDQSTEYIQSLGAVEVFLSPEIPEIITLNEEFVCGNCDMADDLNWYFDGQLVDVTDSWSPDSDGTIQLCVVDSDANNCIVCSDEMVYIGIEDVLSESFIIHENGSSSPWFIANTTERDVVVYNLLGSVVDQFNVAKGERHDFSHYQNGMYIFSYGGSVNRFEIIE